MKRDYHSEFFKSKFGGYGLILSIFAGTVIFGWLGLSLSAAMVPAILFSGLWFVAGMFLPSMGWFQRLFDSTKSKITYAERIKELTEEGDHLYKIAPNPHDMIFNRMRWSVNNLAQMRTNDSAVDNDSIIRLYEMAIMYGRIAVASKHQSDALSQFSVSQVKSQIKTLESQLKTATGVQAAKLSAAIKELNDSIARIERQRNALSLVDSRLMILNNKFTEIVTYLLSIVSMPKNSSLNINDYFEKIAIEMDVNDELELASSDSLSSQIDALSNEQNEFEHDEAEEVSYTRRR